MEENNASVDYLVIGAGIAGASIAAELAADASVLVVEMEHVPGYHTTGRSAALLVPRYGPSPIQDLTRASRGFFFDPPGGFAENPLLQPRAVMMIARQDQLSALDDAVEEARGKGELERLDENEARRAQPLLRKGYAAGAVLDRTGFDIDVHALHHGYIRMLKSRCGVVRTDCALRSLERVDGCWKAEVGGDIVRAGVVINAAGAWADEIGRMAGAEMIGLVPKRRTAMMIAVPPGRDCSALPATVDIEETFYLKPDAGRLLISPANEDPEPPCDVQPDEMDVAICIDRIEKAFDVPVSRIENKWAGLRSFVADKCPVVGYSDGAEGFFWYAGQGGYGIQTAPAMARLGAVLARGEPVPADIADQGVQAEVVSPARFA